MARTKADLIEDAKARGHELTGDETVADLKALLEGDGEEGVEGEEVVEVVEDAPVEAVPGEHIVVDGAVVPQPEGYAKDYRLLYGGRNVEHTHDTDSGVWCYTSKP